MTIHTDNQPRAFMIDHSTINADVCNQVQEKKAGILAKNGMGGCTQRKEERKRGKQGLSGYDEYLGLTKTQSPHLVH